MDSVIFMSLKIIALVIAVAAVVGVLAASGVLGSVWGSAITLSDGTVVTTVEAIQLTCTMSCEPVAFDEETRTGSYLQEQGFPLAPLTILEGVCGDDENTKMCEVRIDNLGESWVYNPEYKRCDANFQNCGEYRPVYTETGYNQIPRFDPFKKYDTNIKLSNGEAIVIKGNQAGVLDLVMIYDAYGLVEQCPTSGKRIVTLKSCNVRDIDKNRVPDDEAHKLTSTTLDFDGPGSYVNYFDAWVIGDLGLNVRNHPTYGDVLCSGRNVYRIQTVETAAGNTYATKGARLDAVDCCPGYRTNAYYCGEDFTLHYYEQDPEPSEPPVISPTQCPGQGDWVLDYGDPTRKTIVRYEVQDNKCVIAESQVVECTASWQCADGVCSGFKCVQQTGPYIPVCGNKICEAGENVEGSPNYCPIDCAPVPGPGEDGDDCAWYDILCHLGKMFSGLSGILLIVAIIVIGFILLMILAIAWRLLYGH